MAGAYMGHFDDGPTQADVAPADARRAQRKADDFDSGSQLGANWMAVTDAPMTTARAKWITPPKPGQPVMIDVLCSGADCRQSVGYVGLPPGDSAMMEARFRCGHCGRETWWRSAR